MISSFKTSFANTSTSPQIVPDGQTRTLLKVSEDSAARQAKLQAEGKPWLCVKHKITVTNEKCKAMKIASDTRQCSDCGLPLALGIVTREELQMSRIGTCQNCGRPKMTLPAKGLCGKCYQMDRAGELKPEEQVHVCLPTNDLGRVIPASKQLVVDHPMMAMQDVPKVEAVEAFPSWDDFEDLSPVLRNHPREIFFAVQTGGKCALSGALADTIGAKAGSMVQVRKGENRLAIRLLTEPEKGALKLTPGKSGQGRLAFGGRTILAQVPLGNGRYSVDVVPWGCIVKTDEPMPVPGKA